MGNTVKGDAGGKYRSSTCGSLSLEQASKPLTLTFLYNDV